MKILDALASASLGISGLLFPARNSRILRCAAEPPPVPVASTGGLPLWARLLHQREHLLLLRSCSPDAKTPDALADATASGGNACSATAESLCSVGLYLQSQPPATLTPALRALLQGRPTHFLPRLEKAEFGGKTDSAAGAALPPPVVVGRGEVFCAPASQTPPPVYQPLLTLRHASLHLSLSAGFEKFWLPAFSLSVVEDDGIRSCAIKLKEGALPLRFALDARAERGR